MKIIEFDPKWVHMVRYELILRLDGALWLRIIFNPLLTQKGAIKIKKKKVLKSVPNQPSWGHVLPPTRWQWQRHRQLSRTGSANSQQSRDHASRQIIPAKPQPEFLDHL